MADRSEANGPARVEQSRMSAAPDAELWVWICRWAEFQHYAPSRDRGPAWIKDYTAQLDDERFLRLTDRQRALLGDLRRIFATMRGRLPDDCSMIARRRGLQTRREDVTALISAGFVQLLSRESLDQRLEDLYASRARPRTREDLEQEPEKKPPSPLPEHHDQPNGDGPEDDPLEKIQQLLAQAAPEDIPW